MAVSSPPSSQRDGQPSSGRDPQNALISSRLAGNSGVAIPAAWRIGQFVLMGLVALLAIWYAVQGYKSPVGDTGSADNFSPFDLVGFVLAMALIFLTTPTAWVVATTTFHEAIRRRWVTALLGFAVVMLAVSTFFTWMQPGSQQKFLRDYGLGFTVIMTLIAAVFLGVALIPPEIERRTIFTILSKPVTRVEFLVGKYLGLMFTLVLNLAVMGTIFLISYGLFVVQKDGVDALTGGNFFANIPLLPKAYALADKADNIGVSLNGVTADLVSLGRALLLHLGTLSIMASFAIMLSQFLTGITAIIVSFVVYFLGQSAAYWQRLSGGSGDSASPVLTGPVRVIADAVYSVLPHLDTFDVRERLVNDLPVGWNYMLKTGSAGATYTAVMLAVAYFAFSEREF